MEGGCKIEGDWWFLSSFGPTARRAFTGHYYQGKGPGFRTPFPCIRWPILADGQQCTRIRRVARIGDWPEYWSGEMRIRTRGAGYGLEIDPRLGIGTPVQV